MRQMITLFVCKKVNKQFKAIYQVRIANGVPAKDQSDNFVRLGQTLFEVMCTFQCSGIQTKYVWDHP